jgi:hypothetical protein
MAVAGQAQGVAFLDDERLAVTPHRGGIYVQTLDRTALLALARAGLTRTLMADECEQFQLDPCPTLDQLIAGPGTP